MQLCCLFGVARSSFYFRSTKRDEKAIYPVVEETAAT